jgi:hypothetical protein
MSQPPPASLADFARRLLREEAGKAESGDPVTGFQSACGALHHRLAPLISSPGFQALLARAIRLAARDFPFLATVSVRTNGECALVGLPAGTDTREPRETADAFAAVLGQFIWLLVIFIGEDLGLRKVREAWPEVPFGDVNPSSGTEQ